MANITAILQSVMTENGIKEVICKSNGENVSVIYNGTKTTLAAVLADILTTVGSLPKGTDVDAKISAAINALIDGAPETYNTLKEIAEYIASDKTAMETLNSAIGGKVDKEDGKGLSANDFTDALKNALEALPTITNTDVENWNAKADKTIASETAPGLMSADMVKKLNGLNSVHIGTSQPDNMQVGDIFIQISQIEET